MQGEGALKIPLRKDSAVGRRPSAGDMCDFRPGAVPYGLYAASPDLFQGLAADTNMARHQKVEPGYQDPHIPSQEPDVKSARPVCVFLRRVLELVCPEEAPARPAVLRCPVADVVSLRADLWSG